MKNRIDLLSSVMLDLKHDWGVPISLSDIDSVRHWYAQEGYPFLASRLPRLDDLLLAGLAAGFLPDYSDWKVHHHSVLPRFLYGAWRGIFDDDGALLDDYKWESVYAIRMVAGLFKKVFEVCEDSKVEAALTAFKDTDSGLAPVGLPDSITSVFRTIYGGKFSFLRKGDFSPNHGPGAVAESLDDVSKWDFPTIKTEILNWYDIADFSPNYQREFEVTSEVSGRVIAVPKTYDKPRLISIEPSASQYAQQGLRHRLESVINRRPQTNVTDQARNRELARQGSVDRSLATIDLSEASDRVSMWLLEHMMRGSTLLSALKDLRTTAVQVGDELVALNKFASMGSPLTFPVQVIVYHVICVWAMSVQDQDLSRANIMRHASGSYLGVYGDDIIVPVQYRQSVIAALELCGFVINSRKSYWTGPFRESCGGDYVDGVDVTPIRVRRQPPSSRRDTDSIVSWCDLSHQLAQRGFDRAAEFASSVVSRCVYMPSGSFLDGLTVSHGPEPKRRYNRGLQSHEVLLPVQEHIRKPNVSNDDDSWLAAFLAAVTGPYRGGLETPSDDPQRVWRRGRPTSSYIKRRWVADR